MIGWSGFWCYFWHCRSLCFLISLRWRYRKQAGKGDFYLFIYCLVNLVGFPLSFHSFGTTGRQTGGFCGQVDESCELNRSKAPEEVHNTWFWFTLTFINLNYSMYDFIYMQISVHSSIKQHLIKNTWEWHLTEPVWLVLCSSDYWHVLNLAWTFCPFSFSTISLCATHTHTHTGCNHFSLLGYARSCCLCECVTVLQCVCAHIGRVLKIVGDHLYSNTWAKDLCGHWNF